MSNYSESSESDSDNSYYKNIEQYINTIEQDNKDKNEVNLFSQIKAMVEEKQKENKNEEMKLLSLQMDNNKLKDQIDEMNKNT